MSPHFLSRNQRPVFGGDLCWQATSTLTITEATIQAALPIQGTMGSHTIPASQHLPVPPPAHETGVIKAIPHQEKKHWLVQCYCFWAWLFEHLWAARIGMTLCCRSHPPPRLHRGRIPPSHKELKGGGWGAALSTTGGSNFILHIVKIVHCWNISTLLNLDSMAWSYLWGVSFCRGLCNILFQPTSALPELEEQGTRLTQTNTGAGLLAFKKKSGSQSLRNTSEGFF